MGGQVCDIPTLEARNTHVENGIVGNDPAYLTKDDPDGRVCQYWEP